MWKKVPYVLGGLAAGDIIDFHAAPADDFDSFDPVERDVTTCTFTCNKTETSRTHAGLQKKNKIKKQNSLPSVSSASAQRGIPSFVLYSCRRRRRGLFVAPFFFFLLPVSQKCVCACVRSGGAGGGGECGSGGALGFCINMIACPRRAPPSRSVIG